MANDEEAPNSSRSSKDSGHEEEEEKYSSRIFVSNPIPIKIKNPDRIQKAELEFHGFVHNKESFEARVFLDNREANHHTAKKEENGYAGSLYIFAHGTRCWGGPGHCQIKERQGLYDMRSSHHLKPTDFYLNITEQVKKTMHGTTKDTLTVTIVPIMMSFDELADEVNILNFKSLSLHIHSR